MAEFWETDPISNAAQSQAVSADWWSRDPEAPPKPKQMSWFEYANNVTRSMASGVTFGYADELAGALGSAGNKAMRAVGVDVPERTYSDIRNEQDQGIRDFRESNPVAAYGTEILGGLATPIGVGASLLKSGMTAGNVAKGALTVGAPIGAATAIGEAKGLDDVGDYVGEGLKGGLIGAGTYGVIAPVAAGLAKGAQTVARAIGYARKPQNAALDKTAQALIDDDIDPNLLRGVIAPKGKETAANRGLTDAQVSELVKRAGEGEDISAIASGMVNPKTGKPFTTLNKYLAEYRDNTDIPMNMIDLAKSLPDSGGAKSLTNLARAAASGRGKAQSIAGKALVNRQLEQGGRVSEHIDRAVGGVNIEDEIARLDDIVGEQAKTAYDAARAQAKPFNLSDVVRKWRGDAKGNDTVSKQLNEAIDTFFDPGLVEQVSMKTGKTMKQLRYTKLLEPTSDMDQFMRSRRGLDQMIDASKAVGGKPTTLTLVLAGLRRDLNNAARKDNDAWLKADAQFSEGKAGQAAIELGETIALRAGGKQRAAMAKFSKLSEEQKELARLGLARQIMDRVTNKRESHDVTQELSTDSVNRVLGKVFPDKSGQRLIRDMEREGITTDTLRDVFGGSQTAPRLQDLGKLQEDAALVGNIVTGNIPGTIKQAADRIMRGLNEQQSREIIQLLTNTRQEELLPLLDALQKAKGRLSGGQSVRNALGIGVGGTASQQASDGL